MYNTPPPYHEFNKPNQFIYNIPDHQDLSEWKNNLRREIRRKEAEYLQALNEDRPFSELKELKNAINDLFKALEHTGNSRSAN